MIKKLFLSILLVCHSAAVWAFDLHDLSVQLQAPDNIKGQFTQQRYLKNLNMPLTSSGKFILIPNKALLWQVESPFAVTMRITQNGIEQLNSNEQWIRADRSAGGEEAQLRLFLGLLGGQTVALENQFNLNLEGEAEQWQLLLEPKTKLLEQIFTQIDIAGDEVVRAINLHETQGDRTEISFENTQLNSELDSLEQATLLP